MQRRIALLSQRTGSAALFDAMKSTRTVPIGKAAVLPIVAAAVVPMVAILAIQMPLKDLALTLLKALI
jgi:hypothetical protein